MVRQASEGNCIRKVYAVLLKLEVNRDIPFLITTGKLLKCQKAPSIPLELNILHRKTTLAGSKPRGSGPGRGRLESPISSATQEGATDRGKPGVWKPGIQ